MKLADIRVPAFTFGRRSVSIIRTRNQRFTMKDIGKIDQRVTAVERMTTLNLLERNAASFEVTDANGLNRFKSGFVVDNFQGHQVGDAYHKDYKVAMDFQKGELRPSHIAKSVDLEENVTTDAARTSAGYQKTGDLLTLPYTEVVLTEQPFASTIERVAPYMTATWKGNVTIDPTQDNWFETEIAPELVINVEGNYDAVTASVGNSLGTVWNAWQSTWAGRISHDLEAERRRLAPPPVRQEEVWDDDGGGEDGVACLTYNMKVMLKNNILINVNKLKLGDEIMTNCEPTIIQELIFNHMREGYYIINGELEITNDHPVLANGIWKRTEDLLIGDVVNGIRINTMKYISKRTPTVSIVTAADNYNVYCNENIYTVHGRYQLLRQQEDRSAA